MSLGDRFELGERELVALVGGGGKSTLLFSLGRELAGWGKRVLVTTTTKMGPGQAAEVPAVCYSAAVADVDLALDGPGPVMLITERQASKIRGPAPEVVDKLFVSARLDHLLVEADGSRGRPLKAPGSHEPVIPVTATLVIIVMGLDAVGRPLAEVAHRPAEAASLTGRAGDDLLTADDCARVLSHPEGGLRGAPAGARVAVALTKVEPGMREVAAARIGELMADQPRIGPVVVLP